jgi:hypothetical protein
VALFALAQGGGGAELEGVRLRPGLAMSQDGKNWARIEGEHHTGALFDVGQDAEWDELFIGGPQVSKGWQAQAGCTNHALQSARMCSVAVRG